MEIDIVQTGSITAGQTTSNEIDIGDKVLCGLQLVGWQTASLSFEVSIDGGNSWSTLIDGDTGSPYAVPTVTGAAQLTVGLDPNKLRGFSSYKVVSSVAQTAGVAISAVCRLVF